MSSLSHKRHKKHKHKKHKKRRGVFDGEEEELEEDEEELEEEEEDLEGEESGKRGLKLKIKIGGQSFGETRLAKAGTSSADHEASASTSGTSLQRSSSKPVDEEEAWLAALEAGRLDEVDEELRRMKDPTLMTARQRSLLESKAHKDREEAQPAAPVEKVMTEEMIQRKIIRAKKRKQQADEKREKDKKQTIERLLKKADAKVKTNKKIAKKDNVPKMTYIVSQVRGFSLSMPMGTEYPLKADVAKPPPPAVLCGVKACKNLKKYSCSKTGVPLCSLQCYKKNLANSAVT